MISRATGQQPFKEIGINFIRELLESKRFNPILVVTDQFTKVQYYLLAQTT